jgi:hypothetical protein
MKKIYGLVLITGLALGAADASETKDNQRIYAPIQHQKYYQNEKELFGYNPNFPPGVVSFGPDNRPYIITRDGKPVIHTMSHENQWIDLDFGKDIKRKFPQWDGFVKTDEFGNARITFDRNGDAYFFAATGRSNLNKALLLHSKDRGINWTVYPLPYKEFGRLESNDTFNIGKHPPAILFYNIAGRPNGELRLIAPEKNPDGTLTIPEPVLVTAESGLSTPHSGDGNNAVSVGDNIHLIWMSNQPDGQKGVRAFAATYNCQTKQVSAPVFVGRSNEFGDVPQVPDNHNLPVMTVDSKGYLHAILGTHHHPFKYVKSLTSDSVEKWSNPESFGIPKTKEKEGSYTYPSISCDPQGNIHTVSRWAGQGYYFALVYNQRNAAEDRWLPQQILVMPFRAMYGCWYHKVSINHQGDLVVYYINYLNQLDKPSLEAYNQKWPEDKINLTPVKTGDWDANIKPHAPAILMRNSSENCWFLATTPDFIATIKRATASDAK